MGLPGRRTGAAVALILGCWASLAAAQAAPAAGPVDSAAPPAAMLDSVAAAMAADTTGPEVGVVRVRGDSLFTLYGRLGTIGPGRRAANLLNRLKDVERNVRAGRDSVVVTELTGQHIIEVGGTPLMVVLPEDVVDSGYTRATLAAHYADQLRTAIERGSLLHRLKQLALAMAGALLATLVLWGLRWLLLRVLERTTRLIGLLRHAARLPTLKIQNLEVLSADRIADGLDMLVRVLYYAVLVTLIYFYLVLVLGLFPFTRAASTRILDFVLEPVGVVTRNVVGYLPDLFFVGVIIATTYYLLKLIKFLFHAIETRAIVLPGFDDDWAMPTYKLVRFMVLAFALIVMWPYLPGSDSPAFQGVSVFVGVLFSLGSTGAVANLVAGSLLTYTRSFQVGDRVRIGETTGDVVARTLMVTRVRTITHVEVTIPNSTVMSSQVYNYSTNARQGGILLQAGITIGYDVPWRRVHELLLAAAAGVEGIEPEPAPFVLQTGLNDYYPAYELNVYISNPQGARRILSDLHARIQDTFAEGGVEITSPAFTAVRDGNAITIPAPHTPAEHPAFRVQVLPSGGSRPGGGPA